MKLYMFWTVPLSIIRGLFTVHSAMVYVIQVCRQLSSRTVLVLLTVHSAMVYVIQFYRQLSSRTILVVLTVHSAMVYVIQVCRQLSSRTRMVLLESCLQTCMTYTIAECTVNKLLMIDRGTLRNMEFHVKINM